MRSIARWCFTHRWLVLAVWVVALIAVSGLSRGIGTAYTDTFTLSGTQSFDALNLLKQASPKAAGDTDQIVIATSSGRVTDPAVRARIQPMLDKIRTLPHVTRVASPYAPGAGSRQVSGSGQVAFATVAFDSLANQLPLPAVRSVVDAAKAAAGAGVRVELGGQAIELVNRPSLGGVGFGILAAGVVLFVVFGSLLGMALPLITALLSLGTGLGVIGLASHAMNMASFTPQLASLIGLGVGVDYALFIVSRYRQDLLAGRTPEEAVVTAVDTSGRAVLFAGITVCIALLGMFALGLSFLYGLAVAASLAVLFTVVAALTLLPAMLGLFGTRVLSRRQRRALLPGAVRAPTDESRRWVSWAARLRRHPAAYGTAGLLVMAVIAIPFLSLRLGSSDQGNDPNSYTTRKAYDLLASGFGPGFNGPLSVVAPVSNPGQQAQLTAVLAAIGRQPGVKATTPPALYGKPGQQVAVASVFPTTSPQDAATSDLVKHLRNQTVPAAAAGTGLRVLIGGQTAIYDDFSTVISGKLPLFIVVVVGLSFLLLMAVFRSLVIPATAAVMNLLSAGAGFGAVTAVFQWGWLSHLIGVDRAGPIEAFLPVMVFAILFGLSMDYEVFLVSRMHEEWQHSKNNDQAVGHGLAVTGRTITAAAAIMVLVFASFILGGLRVIKLFGFSLAISVLLDALVVRSLIVPAVMFKLGRFNWALPKQLDRILPRLSVEPAQPTAEPRLDPDAELSPVS